MFGTLFLVTVLPSLVFASVNITRVGVQRCSDDACHGPLADNGTLCYFGASNYVAKYNVHNLGIAENATTVFGDTKLSFTLTNSPPEYEENNITSFNQSLFLGAKRTFNPGLDLNACAIMLRLSDDRPFPDKERRNNTGCEGSAVTEGVFDIMADAARDYKPSGTFNESCQDLVDIIAKSYSSANRQYSEFHSKDIRAIGEPFMGKSSNKPIDTGYGDKKTQTCYPVLPERDYSLYYIASQSIRLSGGKDQLKDTDRRLGMTPIMTVVWPSLNQTTAVNFMCLKVSDDSSVGGLIRPSVTLAFFLSVLSVFAVMS